MQPDGRRHSSVLDPRHLRGKIDEKYMTQKSINGYKRSGVWHRTVVVSPLESPSHPMRSTLAHVRCLPDQIHADASEEHFYRTFHMDQYCSLGNRLMLALTLDCKAPFFKVAVYAPANEPNQPNCGASGPAHHHTYTLSHLPVVPASYSLQPFIGEGPALAPA